jgi:molybdopterin/thiamine biosynthesis adenylyltransferase
LRGLGYVNARSVRGGHARWQDEGLPMEQGALGVDAGERYARHLVLPEIGLAGQKKLLRARVVLIGAGGLGAPIALYLAAAGVGTLTLIDDDVVERSNLQRQIIHADARIGMPKVESARSALNALNPSIRIEAVRERVRAANVEALLHGHDVIIDGADNFPARYLLSTASLRLGLPLVYGAVHRFSGQVSVFDPRRADSPCYRCLFPQPPSAAEAPNCSEAGVLGVMPGIVGLLQANEALKLILGVGEPLVGRLLCHDALAGAFRELRLPRDPECPGCGAGVTFAGYEDIVRLCTTQT